MAFSGTPTYLMLWLKNPLNYLTELQFLDNDIELEESAFTTCIKNQLNVHVMTQ